MSATTRLVQPEANLIIDSSVDFKPDTYTLPDFHVMCIAASGIVIDGCGAILQGGTNRYAVPPTGDGLYTPGDRTLCVGRHCLESKAIEIQNGSVGRLAFSYAFWQPGGRDLGKIEVLCSGGKWQEMPTMELLKTRADGWQEVGVELSGKVTVPVRLRFTYQVDYTDIAAAPFYDNFQLTDGRGEVLWRGDGLKNHLGWHNNGFSIWRRNTSSQAWGRAFYSTGTSDVTFKNFVIRNFHTGLCLRDVSGWHIEHNDFSDCYGDPDYGWGEGRERFSGIHIEDSRDCRIVHNTASRVWNGLVLRRSAGIAIEGNAFDHCSNTALKMTQSSHNRIIKNNLSWGIRIYPDETHARDSVGVLIESGSNHNEFVGNDITHGGDGVFIRVLNRWCSTGNLFENNDCSYANNNAFESWSPGNTYRRNRANWSSYGFWLGGSDNTILEENEILHNGKLNANAPEPFGNAGVAVVKGSSSHFTVRGNVICSNRGVGLAFGFTQKSPAYHWLIENNDISSNEDDPRGYSGNGVYMFCADLVDFVGNRIESNQGEDIARGPDVTRVEVRETDSYRSGGDGVIHVEPKLIAVGTDTLLRSNRPDESIAQDWDVDRTGIGAGAAVNHVFRSPGFHSISHGVSYLDVYAAPAAAVELPTLDGGWSGRVRHGFFAGLRSCRITETAAAGSGSPGDSVSVYGIDSVEVQVEWSHPAGIDLTDAGRLAFFERFERDYFSFDGPAVRPLEIRLVDHSGGDSLWRKKIDPQEPQSEARYGWNYYELPLWDIVDSWDSVSARADLARIRSISVISGTTVPSDARLSLVKKIYRIEK